MKTDFRPSTKTLRFRLTVYFTAFALILMGILWLLQTALLENYYEFSMERSLKNAIVELSNSYADTENLDYDEFKQEIYDISADSDMYFYMESETGRFRITSTDESTPGRVVFSGLAAVAQARTRLIENGGGSVKFKAEYSGEESNILVYAINVKSPYRENVYLYAFAPLTPLGNTVKIISDQLFIVTVISIILCAFLAFRLSDRISSPLASMRRKAELLARGDYSVDFDGGDYQELDDLADALNYAAGELSKSDNLQKDLMANVSHDLRTPLTMIKSYAELIRDISGENPEKRDEHLQVIIDETDRLSYLVNDILTLSRIQSGVIEMEKERLDLQELCESVLSTYRVMENQEGFDFRLEKIDGPCFVEADPHKIAQVFSNLISNAVRYSGDSKEITLRFLEKEDNIRFELIDHGIGIAPEDLQSIWNRYQRASKQGTRTKEGSGLGLSITREILDRHNADYGVRSKLGQGSTFWFSLPLMKV